MKFKLLPIAASVAVLLQPAIVEAEWNPSPSVLYEVDSNGSSSHTVTDSQGDIITGYSDPTNNNYKFYLKKTSRDGEPLWNGERKLIVDRNQSFIVRWSMVTDPDDAIYTGVEDFTTRQSFIHKTNPDGSPAWDAPYVPTADGVGQSLTIELAYSDGGLGYTFSYDDFSRGSNLQVGMLDDNTGELKWKTDFTVPSGSDVGVQDIVATKDGIVVLAKSTRESDSLLALFVQKYDFDGNPLWGETPQLLTPFLSYSSGNFVRLNADGDGGVALAWVQHDANNNTNIFLQHINAGGESSFDEGGLRISHGSTLDYNAVNMPTIVVSADEITVSWVAQSTNSIPTYTLFTQRVSYDGKLLLGGEPKALHTSAGANDIDWEVFDGGQLTKYGDNYSMVYSRSENAGSTKTHLDRIDFTADGEVVRNVNYADVGLFVTNVSSLRSLYGDTITSFSARESIDDPASLRLQSMDLEGEVGVNGGIVIEYPKVPWVIQEGGSLATGLHFLDDANSTYNINISSSDETVTSEVTEVGEGEFSIAVTPDTDFSGIVPVTVEVTDASDPTRIESLSYKIRVKPVNDAPEISVADLVDANEGEAVVVEAEISDPDSESYSVMWSQTAGQAVDFEPGSENLSFDAPVVIADEPLEFLLSVSDEGSTTEKTVIVNVADQGKPALIISSVSVQEGQTASINPQLSSAKEPLSIEWSQIGGPALTTSSTSDLSVQISAPFVDSDTSATLSLVITDANGESAKQTVTVNITNKGSGKGGGSSNWLLLCLLTAAAFIKRSVKA